MSEQDKLIVRPRYAWGIPLDQGRTWSAPDRDLLVRLCESKINIEHAASTLGRTPSTVVHKARDLGFRLPSEWYSLIRKVHAKAVKLLGLNYPYIVRATDKHFDLVAVNQLVPAGMEGREDVCQDILLAMWESRVSLDDMRKDGTAVRKFMQAFRKASFERAGYGVESLDEPLLGGRSKYEDGKYNRELVNQNDNLLEEYVLNGGAHRFEHDFSSSLISAISREEESLGIPAAMWNHLLQGKAGARARGALPIREEPAPPHEQKDQIE